MDIHQLSKETSERSELFAEVVQACRTLLKNSPEAENERNYIKQRISSHSLDKYSIGYFPPATQLDLLTTYIPYEKLAQLNLVRTFFMKEKGGVTPRHRIHFENHNLILPYKDEYGNIVALVGRTLLEKEERKIKGIPKYKNSLPFHKKLHLFGLSHAKRAICKSNTAIIVEGQIDCISCHSHGYHNVVALAGSSFTRWQAFLLRKMASNIYLLLDNDLPGEKAISKILSKRYAKLANIKTISLPDGFEDVDEYLCKSNNCTIFDRIT